MFDWFRSKEATATAAKHAEIAPDRIAAVLARKTPAPMPAPMPAVPDPAESPPPTQDGAPFQRARDPVGAAPGSGLPSPEAPAAAAPSRTPRPADKAAGAGKRVIVRRSDFEAARTPEMAYALTQGVISFINDLLTHACGLFEDAPASVRWVYYADFYVSQVKNGGHGQFLVNAGAHREGALADAARGLDAMGAASLRAIAADFDALARRRWPQTPEERPVGDPELDALDRRLFADEEADRLHAMSARWIASWPELEVEEDDAYPARIEAIARANPRRAARLRHRAFVGLREQVTDPLQLAAGVVCGAAHEIKLELGTWEWTVIEGQPIQTFALRTSSGARRLVADGAGAALLEPQRQANERPNGLAHRFAEQIAKVGREAERRSIADAVDLLLSRIGYPIENAQITPWVGDEDAERFDLWAVAAQGKPALMLASDAAGATLAPVEDGARHALARASQGEIEAHVAALEREAALTLTFGEDGARA